MIGRGWRNQNLSLLWKRGEGEILSADACAVQKEQGEDPVLKENDILIVSKSVMKAFFIEFRDAVKGVSGFGFSLGAL